MDKRTVFLSLFVALGLTAPGICAECVTIDAGANVIVLPDQPVVTRTLDLTQPVEVSSAGFATQDLDGTPFYGAILVVRTNCKAYVIPNESSVTLDPIGSESEVFLFFVDWGTGDNGGSVTVSFSQQDVFDAEVGGSDNCIDLSQEPVKSVELDLTDPWYAFPAGDAYHDNAGRAYENILLVVRTNQRPYAGPVYSCTRIEPIGGTTQVYTFFVDATPITDNSGQVEICFSTHEACEFAMRIQSESEEPYCAGDEARVDVLMSNPYAVQGFSIGIGFDASGLELNSVTLSGTAAEGAQFFNPYISEEGWSTAGVIMSTDEIDNPIPAAEEEQPIIGYVFLIQSQASPGSYAVGFEDGHIVSVNEVRNELIVGGRAIVPELEDGAVDVIQCRFLRGNCRQDSAVNITDAMYILELLFGPTPEELPGCQLACDANRDCFISVSDAVYLLNFLFRGGSPPILTFPSCESVPEEPCLPCGDPLCPL